MAAYAEGLNILRHANAGLHARTVDAETTPLRNPEHYQYELNLADITEVWRRGSVVASWLLDLTAAALTASPGLDNFSGRVSDSGEGRWTIQAAIDESAPAPVLSAALVSALHLARRRRFRRQSFIRPALPIRRPRRNQGRPLIAMLSAEKVDQAAHHLLAARKAKTPGPAHARSLSPRRYRFRDRDSGTGFGTARRKSWRMEMRHAESAHRTHRRRDSRVGDSCAHCPARCPARWD